METQKLYYQDCHLQSFCAKVVSCTQVDSGFAVVLDATAFYPQGGGQACDLGTLDDIKVLDVYEQKNAVVHLCEKSLPIGKTVAGRIDYARRFDLMQQHTGEHIVSGIIHRRFGYHNVGFHMGADVIQIDFDGMIPSEALPEIEWAANQAVWANLPVSCWYPAPEELPHITYRAKRQLDWPVRIVKIGDVDSCACCGVHTAYTGEVGMIKIFSCIKFHQGVRLEMACGSRALQYLTKVFDQNRQISRIFSAKPLETAAAAQQFTQQLAAEKFRCTGLERQLFDTISAVYKNKNNVLHFQENISPTGARELAQRIANQCSGIAVVVVPGENISHICISRPGCDLSSVTEAITTQLCVKGGGKNGLFQGTLPASRDKIESFFHSQWELS